MKTFVILIAGACLALAPGALRAQGASAVIDEALINATNNNHSQIMAILERQLSEAENQSQRLQEQLDRLGDPRTVNLDSIAMIKEDIQKSANSLKTESELNERMGSLTGSEVFENNAFGVMPAIGSTITRKDGTVVDRDPEKYKMEAAMHEGVHQYKRVREEVLQRKKEIAETLGNVIEQLQNAQDLATVQKLQAMVVVLRGQMDECNQTLMMARDDADMIEKELVNQARIITKGKQEESKVKNQTDADPTAPLGTQAVQDFARTMKPPSSLPWGRKGSEGNPGTGGSGTSSVP